MSDKIDPEEVSRILAEAGGGRRRPPQAPTPAPAETPRQPRRRRLRREDAGPAATIPPRQAPEVRTPQLPPRAPEAPRKKRSRDGKVGLTVYVKPEVRRQLRQMGLDQERSVEDIVREALNDIFSKYGHPPIAGT